MSEAVTIRLSEKELKTLKALQDFLRSRGQVTGKSLEETLRWCFHFSVISIYGRIKRGGEV